MKNLTNKMKNMKGITLVALIITIIILLILAGVVINMTIGNDGIISKAQGAVDMYKNAQEKEEMQIAKVADGLDEYVGGNRDYATEINELKSKITTLKGQVDALENTQNNVTGTIYDSTLVASTWNKATWTKLRTITLEPGNYVIQLTFDCGPKEFNGSGNVFIGLGSGNSLDNIGSDSTYVNGQWARCNSSYIVSPNTTTTYNMGIWTDFKASSEMVTPPHVLQMKAIRIK